MVISYEKVFIVLLISCFSLTIISCDAIKENSTSHFIILVHYLLRWEIMEQFLPRLMDPHGLQGLLEQRKISMESPMQTVPLL